MISDGMIVEKLVEPLTYLKCPKMSDYLKMVNESGLQKSSLTFHCDHEASFLSVHNGLITENIHKIIKNVKAD
jgi:hypothetical protein